KLNCKNRGVSDIPVDRVVTFENARKALVQKRSETAARKNEISGKFKNATPEERQALRDQSAALDKEIGVIDDELKILEGDLRLNLMQLPNMTHPAAPVGGEEANKVVAQFGTPRKFDFEPKDHYDLCVDLDLADFDAGVRVAGPKFYFLKNEAALLEVALVQY